ncbi:hypothetical protein I317_02472 [Kwoniella heveanensis CBS 569]|nr:hypothetical protein I317_02472 [Kwoniella heveanensis CBS 569]
MATTYASVVAEHDGTHHQSSNSDRKPTLIIYGATSFTARQLILYLDTHTDGKLFDFILAGRNQTKLETTNQKLAGGKRKIAVCQLNDEEAVKKLVEKGDVVVNLAGPFRWHNAEALIRECARTGKHYVDLNGESAWLATEIIPRYHDLASSTGACIVPSCGFDSVPSDITLYTALKTLQTKYGKQATIADSTSLFKLKGGSMSGGTIQTMYSVAELPKDQRRSGEFDLVPKSAPLASRRSTIPSLAYALDIPGQAKRFASFFFMYPFNRTIIRRSAYLSTFNDNDDQTQSIAQGNGNGSPDAEPVHDLTKEMKYAEGMDTGKGKWGSGLFSAGLFLAFGLFFGSSLIRKLASYILPKAGEGATDENLHKASYVVTNVSTSNPLPEIGTVKVITTFKAHGDPGYLSTCHLLAESALSLVLPPPSSSTSLPPLARKGGCLTPATALGGVLVDRLNRSGKVTIESRVVESEVGKKKDL